jgi:hypothetical protein
MKQMEEITTVAKAMAREMILLALLDIKKAGDHSDDGADALRWFNERLTTPFGYGWCLQQGGMNPNAIRKAIEFYLKNNR